MDEGFDNFSNNNLSRLICTFEMSIFRTLCKVQCCTKFLFIELETSNFGYLLFFLIFFDCAKFQKDWTNLILDILFCNIPKIQRGILEVSNQKTKNWLNNAAPEGLENTPFKEWQEAFKIKMNSLYQISSKMLYSTKVIILVGKKEKRWPGWDLNSRPPC